jgi:ABC-type transport system substrate-binding protein
MKNVVTSIVVVVAVALVVCLVPLKEVAYAVTVDYEDTETYYEQDMYYELQERYYEDAPSIMLCQPLSRHYFTKYIHGFYFNPMIAGQAGPLYYMSKSSS